MIKPGSLGCYMFIRNGVYYDYPFVEAIQSALPICDQFVVCECGSDKDNTLQVLEEWAVREPKLTIIQHDWVTHHSQLSLLGNYCVPFLNTQWIWQVQADEVLHEDHYSEIRDRVQNASENVSAYLIHYHHFLASYFAEFNFCYENIIRIARKGSGWWLAGDACQLDRADKRGVVDTGIYVYHYGKVHEGKVGYQKEVDFQALYTDLGFPDPKMKEMKEKIGEECDYVYLFEQNIIDKKVWKFTGTHPALMKERIAKFQGGGWEQFESKMKEGLKLL